MIIAIASLLSFAFGQLNVILIMGAAFFSLLISAAIASERRRRLSKLSIDELSKLKNVKTIEWQKISVIEIKGAKLNIRTTQGNYSSWIRPSSIPQISPIIQSHSNVHFRVLKYRWHVLALSAILPFLSLVFLFVPQGQYISLLSFLIVEFALVGASVILICTFFFKLREVN